MNIGDKLLEFRAEQPAGERFSRKQDLLPNLVLDSLGLNEGADDEIINENHNLQDNDGA